MRKGRSIANPLYLPYILIYFIYLPALYTFPLSSNTKK